VVCAKEKPWKSEDGYRVCVFVCQMCMRVSKQLPVTASARLQHHINLLEAWATKWKIKINETKSIRVTFTLRKNQCPLIFFYNILIPESPSVRYLGMHWIRN